MYENVQQFYPGVSKCYPSVLLEMCKNVFVNSKCTKMFKNVISVYENVHPVYIFAHKNKGVQKGGQKVADVHKCT